MIPDILNFWLTGVLRAEYTSATTTQMVDARARTWARSCSANSDIPRACCPSSSSREPSLAASPGRRRASTTSPVVVPACHDTGSAVASVAGTRAFLSSGTWSLLGIEMPQPIITPRA